jgi:hypothetical protein
MSAYARGKHAIGICDRTGFEYPLKDLVPEYVNGTETGLLVGRDVADGDHPQNFVGRRRIIDPQALKNPRPDTHIEGLFGWNPVGNPEDYLRTSMGQVSVRIG